MPVAVRITPHHMSTEDYERLIAELEAAGVREPKGRLLNAVYGADELRMFEVWESPELFEEYRERLFAVIQAASLGAPVVEIDELHSYRHD